MKEYTVAETYTLPSKGKIYNSVVPDVKLRAMSTMDEMKRLSPSDTPYKSMSEIIDDCIVDDIGISSYDLCVGDYLFLMHRLRVVTYGSNYKLVSECPYCGCENTDTINLLDIPIKEYSEEVEKYRFFTLPSSKKEVLLKFQTPRMIDSVQSRVKEIRKKAGNEFVDPTLPLSIAYMISEIDGVHHDFPKVEAWVKSLSMADTNTILNYADKLNQSIGLDLVLQNECEVCGLTFATTFRTTSEFFRPSLDI